ncbi:MAG TPA: PKD domain-containing protein, partial [Thermoplasmata archaeon]|nr:PKD domain-containing protein [Thermoplasmata archaeon]
MAEETQRSAQGRWRLNRAMSTPTAAVIMIVVIAVVGAGGYFAFNSSSTNSPKSGTTTIVHCTPPSSPVCSNVAATHDVALLIPFSAARTGNLVPVTASVPPSDGTPSSYTFNFGDGSTTTGAAATVNHAYTEPGSYIISATATIGGAAHDSFHSLGLISVVASSTSLNAQNVPGVTGTVVANTSSSTAATAIITGGQFVTVSGAYTGQPTNPDYVSQSPTVVSASGGTVSAASNTTTSATATVTFANSGVYWVKFAGSAKSLSTGTVVDQNYTFTVFVSPTGVNSGAQVAGVSSSKHSGQLIVYEEIPGGSTSADPAIDYETAGYETILNVYEQLIAYNGSVTGPSPGAYVPVLAACVPGSTTGANNCLTKFGSSLVNGNDYTFVLDGGAQFYDPATKASWGVYPTDVMFSVARTMGFAV